MALHKKLCKETPGRTRRITYDANGNIMRYTRNGTIATGKLLAMDALSYNYTTGTNKLTHVNDAVATTNYPEDIDDQGAGNYTYDAIGNMVSDAKAGITKISWTVYGKIENITKGGGTISYTYDAAGNRISKTVGTKTTVYVRDATGNVMALYEAIGTDAPRQVETHLYGSSRLGIMTPHIEPAPANTVADGYGTAKIATFTRGEKFFELSNHLGNVLTTVSDKRIAVISNGALAYYSADIITASDYAPFGMQLEGRKISSDKYRYGFNGKENDNEVKGEGNQQDYGMRIYDPRLGRFLSTDPLTKKFPMLTPYQFASNTPIQAIDLDGLESVNVNTNKVDNTLNPQTVSTYQGNKDYKPWEDLIKFKPSETTLKDAKNRVSWFRLQDIEKAVGEELNLDYYSVTINKLPKGFKTAEDFYSYFRSNLSGFVQGGGSDFEEYNSKEGKIWNSSNPLSSVMRFQINTPVYNLDDASVLTSKYSSNNWVFSPVFTYNDLGHPVSGNRQFGITNNTNRSFTFFTRGADRINSAADRDLGGQTVFEGANLLWTTTMRNVATYINTHGGSANVNPRISKRIDWKKDYLNK